MVSNRESEMVDRCGLGAALLRVGAGWVVEIN
jgi:hypothetical protein